MSRTTRRDAFKIAAAGAALGPAAESPSSLSRTLRMPLTNR